MTSTQYCTYNSQLAQCLCTSIIHQLARPYNAIHNTISLKTLLHMLDSFLFRPLLDVYEKCVDMAHLYLVKALGITGWFIRLAPQCYGPVIPPHTL